MKKRNLGNSGLEVASGPSGWKANFSRVWGRTYNPRQCCYLQLTGRERHPTGSRSIRGTHCAGIVKRGKRSATVADDAGTSPGKPGWSGLHISSCFLINEPNPDGRDVTLFCRPSVPVLLLGAFLHKSEGGLRTYIPLSCRPS